MNEKLNYIKDGDYYLGTFENFRAIAIITDSLEELIESGRSFLKQYLEYHLRALEEPFDLEEFKTVSEWLGKEHSYKEELDKYKELFGEINY